MEGLAGLEITDLGRPMVNANRFHFNVTNEMKDHMRDAYIQLLGKDGGVVFAANGGQKTLVSGVYRNHHDGYNQELCLRIDRQGTHTERVGNRDIQFANVQIQLNQPNRPSTIAQVHFQCGLEIPGDSIRNAFEKSWKEKKIIYVYN